MKITIAITVVAVSLCSPAGAQEFLRGDVNLDGQVTLADCYALTGVLFAAQAPACRESGDVNGDDAVMLDDATLLFSVFTKGAAIPAPRTANAICQNAGAAQAPEEAVAELVVLDAEAPGGTDRNAVIKIALKNARLVGAYRGTIDLGGIIANFEGRHNHYGLPVPDDLSDTVVESLNPQATLDLWSYVRVLPDTMEFGFVRMQNSMDPIMPSREAVPVLEFNVCLAEGVRAGSYPIRLIEGEVVDDGTGQAIDPGLRSGILTVKKDLARGVGCQGNEQECPPPAGDFKDLSAVLSLPQVVARQGDTFTVPLKIFATADVRGYSFSIGFDGNVLVPLLVDFTYRKPDGTDYFIQRDRMETPGLVSGGAFFSNQDDCNNVPANVETELLVLTFTVPQDAPPGVHPLRFLDNGDSSMNTVAVVFDQTLPLDQPGSLTFREGTVFVILEESPFRRADSNADGRVDLSDSVKTLNFLFLGDDPPSPCPDAADANDDGALDLSDAVSTFEWLFLDGIEPGSPGPASCGPDPTADGLTPCFYHPAHCQ